MRQSSPASQRAAAGLTLHTSGNKLIVCTSAGRQAGRKQAQGGAQRLASRQPPAAHLRPSGPPPSCRAASAPHAPPGTLGRHARCCCASWPRRRRAAPSRPWRRGPAPGWCAPLGPAPEGGAGGRSWGAGGAAARHAPHAAGGAPAGERPQALRSPAPSAGPGRPTHPPPAPCALRAWPAARMPRPPRASLAPWGWQLQLQPPPPRPPPRPTPRPSQPAPARSAA
jgi:hypothetical protein